MFVPSIGYVYKADLFYQTSSPNAILHDFFAGTVKSYAQISLQDLAE